MIPNKYKVVNTSDIEYYAYTQDCLAENFDNLRYSVDGVYVIIKFPIGYVNENITTKSHEEIMQVLSGSNWIGEEII